MHTQKKHIMTSFAVNTHNDSNDGGAFRQTSAATDREEGSLQTNSILKQILEWFCKQKLSPVYFCFSKVHMHTSQFKLSGLGYLTCHS